MLKDGLIPRGINMKVASCYGAGMEHVAPQLTENMDTFTRNFAQKLGEDSLSLGRGLPTHVDGYVGGVQNQSMVITEDGRGHRGANVKDKSKDQQIMQGYEYMPPKDLEEAQRITSPYRAKDNRVRYRLDKTDDDGVKVSVDRFDLARAKTRRERAQMEKDRVESERMVSGISKGLQSGMVHFVRRGRGGLDNNNNNNNDIDNNNNNNNNAPQPELSEDEFNKEFSGRNNNLVNFGGRKNFGKQVKKEEVEPQSEEEFTEKMSQKKGMILTPMRRKQFKKPQLDESDGSEKDKDKFKKDHDKPDPPPPSIGNF
jgi:hypothetical protein